MINDNHVFDECKRQVADFMISFGASLDPRMWLGLIREEVKELIEAFESEGLEQQLKESCDVIYVICGYAHVTGDFGSRIMELMPEAEVEELNRTFNDLAVSVAEYEGTFEANVFAEAFHRVHQSNMSKLDDNGQPIRREDGKIMKGPNYKAPDLSDLV